MAAEGRYERPMTAERCEFEILSKHIPEVQIRYFSPDQRCEAKAWLLSSATSYSLSPILG
jgi:hypothetical protein